MPAPRDTEPTWLTIFLDLPAERYERGSGFWQEVTGYRRSSTRGERDEFATLLPAGADAHLKVQRTGAAEPGVHLDVHVTDLDAAVESAVLAGAELVARPGHAILRSPSGFTFCLVTEVRAEPAPPSDLGAHRSRVDQLTIDVAHDAWDSEKTFWAEVTGWPVRQGSRAEFARLGTPARLPVRILLQRRDVGPSGGHVDLATDDREAEVARLVALGAERASAGAGWTVMVGPAGDTFCVTDRRPDTGLLG